MKPSSVSNELNEVARKRDEREVQARHDRESLHRDAPSAYSGSLYALIAQFVAGEAAGADPAYLGACALTWVANDIHAIWALHEDSNVSPETLGQLIFQAEMRARSAAELIDRIVAANRPTDAEDAAAPDAQDGKAAAE